MSDTPITDKLAKREFITDGIWIRHARELERENAALRNEIARLNGQTMWICSCGGTDCAGQKENAELREAKDAYFKHNNVLVELMTKEQKEKALEILVSRRKEAQP